MSTAITYQKWTHQHEAMPDWVDHYWSTRHWSSRDTVLEALRAFPARSQVVELGCNVGPMLARISETFPLMRLSGLDANPVAVGAAQERVPYATVTHGDVMTWLPQQAGKSQDVVLTHYTLAYIAPQDILGILYQCQRIARAGLILAEPTGPEKMIFAYPEWRHDYPALLRRLGMVNQETWPVEMDGNHLNQVTKADLR